MKSQHDILARHAGAQEDIGKSLVGFVGFDPDLAVFDAKMKGGFALQLPSDNGT